MLKYSYSCSLFQVVELSEEVSELAQRGFASKEPADDKSAPYRQQALIIARKKGEIAETFTQIKTALDTLKLKLKVRLPLLKK